jgi:hypothetical protein
MKKLILSFLFLTIFTLSGEAKTVDVDFQGKIGKYSIEMTISELNWEKGTFKGVYSYSGKTAHLDIEGEISGPCLYIEEYYKDEVTGYFYVGWEEETFSGKWVGVDRTSHDVSLDFVKGSWDDLKTKTLKDYSLKTNKTISGSYGVEHYWVNDWFYNDENPEVEIGFGGGYAIIEEIDNLTLRFQVEVVCGPTYHIAYAEGEAYKKDGNYVWNYREENDDCVIWFKFNSDGMLTVESNNHNSCYFGARAYLGHDFTKVSDKVNFREDTSLSKIKEDA